MQRSTAARACAAILAAVITFSSATATHAGCSADDMLNAAQNAWNDLSSSCLETFADPADYIAFGVLAGVGALSPQFCQGVQTLSNAQGGASNVVGDLKQGGFFNGLSASEQQSISDALSGLASAGDALGVASCACSVVDDQGLGQLISDLGACLQDGLCDFANWIHSIDPGINACSGGVNVVPVNCTGNPCTGSGWNMTCNYSAGLWPEECGSGPCKSGDGSVQCKQQPGGGEMCSEVMGADANGTITVTSCFCPAPMKITQHQGVDGSGDPWPYFTCDCPSGTHVAGTAGPLSGICICNNTNLPAQAAGGPGGICPFPLTGLPCPKGQVSVRGKCAPQCASPSQVRLANGTCCDPAQVTACGSCCPPGQRPDASTGDCTSAVPQPRPPVRR